MTKTLWLEHTAYHNGGDGDIPSDVARWLNDVQEEFDAVAQVIITYPGLGRCWVFAQVIINDEYALRKKRYEARIKYRDAQKL